MLTQALNHSSHDDCTIPINQDRLQLLLVYERVILLFDLINLQEMQMMLLTLRYV
jgi:hypothetical protein